ncbi:MAG: cytochrome C oxidase subunit IV family protein [Elusimicrobiota bacterium]|nr:cytochrome C oxidase subunit IV family protein [Elusimicrobiota bacterium]
MSNTPDAAHDEHRPNVALYVKVFGALMMLTLITVAVSKVHLPRPQAIGLGLFVATIKAGLVGALFMHLWGENKLIHKALWVTVGGAAILVLPMIDFVLVAHKITNPIAVADQHPGGHGVGHAESVTETITLPGSVKPAAKGH